MSPLPHTVESLYLFSSPDLSNPAEFGMSRAAVGAGLEVAAILPTPLLAAAPPSQHPITMAERRPAAPGLSHLLPQDFLSDSVRKLCRYLLLSLLHWPRWAGIRRPFPVHLLTIHTDPRQGSQGATSLQKLQFPKILFSYSSIALPNGKAPKHKEAGSTHK